MRSLLLLILSVSLYSSSCKTEPGRPAGSGEKQSGAATSLDLFAAIRSYPDGHFYSSRLYKAHQERAAILQTRSGGGLGSTWEALGPKNFGGRTLCLAFHPDDPNTFYAGSASGGLWKSTSAGAGVNAWEYVSTGYPVLGVGAIAINPEDPEEIYIGTGEVYNYDAAMPGTVDRFTRGSYGIGILKTVDGGLSWSKSLDWSLEEMTGVQDLLINPDRPATVFAATTEGLFRSYDSGNNWALILNYEQVVDIEMHPQDTSILMVSVGNLNSPDNGIFRSLNGGNSFNQLTNGLPASFSGKTLLAFSPSQPNIVYASVANVTNSIGMFRSDDMGNSWIQMNTSNVASYQGWYSHDVAVDPNDPDRIIWTGIDAYLSENGGSTLEQLSYWSLWDFGQTPVGGPEGPPNYVHADIHGAYFHPAQEDVAVLATDGGVFLSSDGGYSWEGRNGSMQTQQFYADFGVSQQDSTFYIGGLQDNASAIFIGDDAWVRILGGDGMTGAVYPFNDSILLGSYYYLNVSRSMDRGDNFIGLSVSSASNEQKPFNAPFGFAPAVPNRIYAAATRLHRSDDLGLSWQSTSAGPVDGGNMIITIGQSAQNEDLLIVSTVPGPGNPSVLGSNDGGVTWFPFSGLPDRVCTDAVIDPTDQTRMFLVFSGFGTPHLYRSENYGSSWEPIETGIPDVPGNALLIDPENPEIIYYACDLGVYVSFDGGDSFEPFTEGLPDAVLAMHLSYSPANRNIVLATHGNGVYKAPMLDFPVSVMQQNVQKKQWSVYPNPVPVGEDLHLSLELTNPVLVKGLVLDISGKIWWEDNRLRLDGTDQSIDLPELSSGTYVFQIIDPDGYFSGARMFVIR